MNKENQLKDKLAQEVDVADWAMLEDHYQRGALVTVSADLNLVEVAEAIAEDRVDQVKGWMRKGLVTNTQEEETSEWRKSPNRKVVEFLIVQPYVLVRALVN